MNASQIEAAETEDVVLAPLDGPAGDNYNLPGCFTSVVNSSVTREQEPELSTLVTRIVRTSIIEDGWSVPN